MTIDPLASLLWPWSNVFEPFDALICAVLVLCMLCSAIVPSLPRRLGY